MSEIKEEQKVGEEKKEVKKSKLVNKASLGQQGYINKLHYYYGGGMLAIIIILLTALNFANSGFAGSMLSFAATLSSVLLAVIAIIITLLDVAGQRNNILDVKNSVEELKVVSHEISELVFDFESRIQRRDDQMLSLMTQFDIKNGTTNEKIEELANKLDTISESGDTKGGISEIKEDLGKIMESLKTPTLSKSNRHSGITTDSKAYRSKVMRNLVGETINEDERINYLSDIVWDPVTKKLKYVEKEK